MVRCLKKRMHPNNKFPGSRVLPKNTTWKSLGKWTHLLRSTRADTLPKPVRQALPILVW